jgi:hypothetical protein
MGLSPLNHGDYTLPVHIHARAWHKMHVAGHSMSEIVHTCISRPIKPLLSAKPVGVMAPSTIMLPTTSHSHPNNHRITVQSKCLHFAVAPGTGTRYPGPNFGSAGAMSGASPSHRPLVVLITSDGESVDELAKQLQHIHALLSQRVQKPRMNVAFSRSEKEQQLNLSIDAIANRPAERSRC